jgi:hypothetical protein
MRIFLLLLGASALITASQAAQPVGAVSARATTALQNWRSITSDFIRDPSQQDVVSVIRKEAVRGADDRARLVLLNAEDASTIQMCLDELRNGDAFQQARAARVVGASGQAGLIPSLAEELGRDEPTKSKRVSAGEEVIRVTPISVLATQAILNIIIESARFNPATKAWATSLAGGSEKPDDRERSRAALRLWWQQNASALKTRQYSRIQPPK